MATIEILEQDRVDSENFLEQFLTDNVSAADFGKGGALRDFAVVAMSAIFAYLRKEQDITRARQSLLLLKTILDQADVDDAIDEKMSDWFLTRKTGRKASGVVTLYFSQRENVNVPVTAAFFKTSALIFYPNTSDSVYPLSEDDMVAVVDETGVVTAYSVQMRLIAAAIGEVYDVDPGPFVDFSRFSPYLIKVENASKFSNGTSKETSDEMLSRSETAVSLRNLISPRSIDALLKEMFTTVDDVLVIGHGDAEMIRDIVGFEVANTRIHVGGHTDVYLRSPIEEEGVFNATVGAEFTDPRPGYFILRDFQGTDFEAAGVVRGHVIQIQNAYAVEADKYIVNEVTPYGVFVSRRAQFPMALPVVDNTSVDGSLSVPNVVDGGSYIFTADDVGKYVRVKDSLAGNDITAEILSVNTAANTAVLSGVIFVAESPVAFDVESRIVRFSIGDNSPLYTDMVSINNEGAFTKTIQRDGRVLLPSVPIYRVKSVYVVDPAHVRADADGKVWFLDQINIPPAAIGPGDNLTFRLIGHNPEEVYSGYQLLELELGFTTGNDFTEFNDKAVVVVYDTLSGYEDIWQYMVGDEDRVVCASVIPKGLHSVYLDMEIRYKIAKTATVSLDADEVKEALVIFVNTFDTREDLDSSDITTFIRQTFDVIGYIESVTINYRLMAPDGRVIYYQTEDTVSIESNKHRYPAQPENCLDPTAAPPYNASAISLGVSDNTVRYLTAVDLITLTVI